MNRIRLLSEKVANQIAAGEVVERPASVVKELVENAIDAGATRIQVEIQAGGRSLIRVTDDGVGMNRDDALLCLERHATSKIRQAEDLDSIGTMGFRGEALPSIASVSRMTLTTLARGQSGPATAIIIHGGRIREVKEAGAPEGTCVEVRQLFFNLPARRKFLRTQETEYGHVSHFMTLAALAHPGIAFTLIRDSKMLWKLPPAKADSSRMAALAERMKAVSGMTEQLIPVDFEVTLETLPPPSGPDADWEEDPEVAHDVVHPSQVVRVWGLIGKPGVSRSTRQDHHLFVNQRPVENRPLNMALMEGYHTALMKGRYPVCCLFIELDPSEVDVNIHPAKREVKFRNHRALKRIVAQAIRQALLDYHGSIPAGTTSQEASPVGQAFSTDVPTVDAVSAESSAPPSETPGLADWARGSGGEGSFSSGSGTNITPGSQEPGLTLPGPGPAGQAQPAVGQETTPSTSAPAGDMPLLSVPLRILGVVGRLYVVLESDRGLVLMDQHAAHERVLYEQMLRRMEQEEEGAPSQRLLLPETVELTVRDAQFVRDHLGTLNFMGVGLSDFGECTFLLDALPPFVKVADPAPFVKGLVDELKAAGQEVNSHRLGEDVIAKTVCRHAVKANDPLAEPELAKLLENLRGCSMPYTCPHGRPTLIEMSFGELEKRFGRTV